MRSYLIKTEEQYTFLAMQYYQEEINKSKATKQLEEKKRSKGKTGIGNNSEAV